MKKLLRPKDILLLSLATMGDLAEEIKDPLHLLGNAYKSMYGFVPPTYKKHNFVQTLSRELKTGEIEKVIKNGRVYVRLTAKGKSRAQRDFPIIEFTKSWSGKWILVIFDIEETSRKTRDVLRNRLKNLGFGMLQKSIWLSPLPLGAEMREVIEAKRLEKHVFVLEVSNLIAGDPKELVAQVWNIEKLEKQYIELKESLVEVEKSIESLHDREQNRDDLASDPRLKSLIMERVRIKRKMLLFLANFPLIPAELLPPVLKDFWKKKFI